MPLEWVSNPRIFVSRRREWSALHDADPEATFFHTPEYLKLYWEEFGGRGLRVALVGEPDDPIGVCAFEVRGGLLRFLGGSEVTDYMGPLARPDDRVRVAEHLMEGVAARDDWSRADLAGLPAEGAWMPILAEAAERAGLEVQVSEDDVAPMIDLPPTWEGYLAALSSKLRHEIRRKDRRLREVFPDARLVDASPRTLPSDLGRFLEMHRASEGAKGRFMGPGMELFFRHLGRALLPRGVFRLVFLEGGGRTLAGAVAIEFEGTLSLYNSAYDRARAGVAPGMVLIADIIRDAVGRGCRRLDMLKGDLDYKYRFGARPRAIRRLLLGRG